MDFGLYYKAQIYEIGYNNGYDKEKNRVPNDNVTETIIANYEKLFEVSENDKKIIEAIRSGYVN